MKRNFLKRGWLPVVASILLVWVSLIPLPFLEKIPFDAKDKVLHFIAYFLLAGMYMWALGYFVHHKVRPQGIRRITFTVTAFLGGIIELLQHYLPINRYGDWFDFFFDIVGIIAAFILFPMMHRKIFTTLVFVILILPGMVSAQNAPEDARAFQDTLNAEYANPKTSPLTPEDLAKFKKLKFFKIDTTYRVKAKLVKVMDSPFFKMPTTTDRLPEYRLWAVAVFLLHGKEYKLNIYQNKKLMNHPEYSDYLFLPFTDLTNGKSTYGGGRYIDLRIPDGDTIIIDFNKAYNPYCAYNHKYSCPIVPEDNFLDTEIRAGVKKFK